MLLVVDCQRISEKLLVDPAAVWEMHGESVLECLALTDPVPTDIAPALEETVRASFR